ncbi:MAG: DUF924 domain-containing protein [Candidatus Eremiobacteraeota bacterium]|nr:DUF924 domain-containing protein [Candidatus Eremiobacteraeota bacterium]
MQAQDVLRFWFEELKPSQWFKGGEEVDELIRSRFCELIEQVHGGEHDGWAVTPEGRLALVLTLDQFPRNLYRGQPRAFAYDEKALALVLEGLQQRADEELGPHQRAFFYLPLEHSEEIQMQDLSLAHYANLVLSAPPDQRAPLRNYLEFAWKHYAIIKRFGRYPHRNDILGRTSSQEERKFLKTPGSSF